MRILIRSPPSTTAPSRKTSGGRWRRCSPFCPAAGNSYSRLIADIELETTDAPNNAERRQRKHFYQKSGYRSSGVQYRWREESYEIIVSGGDFDKADFRSFWNAFGVSKGVFSKA